MSELMRLPFCNSSIRCVAHATKAIRPEASAGSAGTQATSWIADASSPPRMNRRPFPFEITPPPKPRGAGRQAGFVEGIRRSSHPSTCKPVASSSSPRMFSGNVSLLHMEAYSDISPKPA